MQSADGQLTINLIREFFQYFELSFTDKVTCVVVVAAVLVLVAFIAAVLVLVVVIVLVVVVMVGVMVGVGIVVGRGSCSSFSCSL